MMPHPEPSSPSSKEPAAPPSGTPAPPPPGPEKKPDKKLETPVLVALISASVTLVAAILGSPLLSGLVNKPDTPAPTPAVQFVTSQNTPLPKDPPGSELIKAGFTPAESGAQIIGSTSTPGGENPTSAPPLIEPAFTATTLPSEEPGPPTPAEAWVFQCLAADFWFPYPSTLKPGIRDGCWDLAEWGFTTGQGQLLLVHKPAQDQQRGIYTPIPGDVDIHFSIQLNEFRTRVNKVGFLNFGVVQNDPFSNYKGGFLSYQQPSPGAASPVRVLISGSHQATQKISVLEAGFQQDVLLSIQDDLMVVYLNGEQTGDPVSLSPADRAFWIGYVLPSKSELDVLITGFTFQAH